MPIGKGYPHCNGVQSLGVDSLNNFRKITEDPTGQDISAYQVHDVPIDVCFPLWRRWDYSRSWGYVEPLCTYAILAKVIITDQGPQLQLWFTQLHGQPCAEACDHRGAPDVVKDLDPNSPSGTIAINHQFMSQDGATEGQYAELKTMSYTGLVHQKAVSCGYSMFIPGMCGTCRNTRRFEFMATCREMPSEGSINKDRNYYWKNWWRYQQCEEGNVHGYRLASEKACLFMADASEAHQMVNETEKPIKAENGEVTYDDNGFIKCVSAPEGGIPVRPTTPNYRWENSDPKIGCSSDTEVTHHFMSIFEGTVTSGTPDDPQSLLDFAREMREDEKNLIMEILDFDFVGCDDEKLIGGRLTADCDTSGWNKEYAVCAAFNQVSNRAEGGIVVKWSISQQDVEKINRKAKQMDELVREEKNYPTGFEKYPRENPFKVEYFYYQLTSQLLLEDEETCGLKARFYKKYVAAYKGDASKLLEQVNEMKADQCEFWLRKVMNKEFGMLSASSEVCVGCIDVISSSSPGTVDVKYWLSSTNADEVDKAQVTMEETWKTAGSKPKLNEIIFDVQFVSSTKIEESTSYPMCGPKVPHRTVIRTRFEDFRELGATSDLVDHWDQKCENWVSEVMEVPLGWSEVEKVCTGCNKVTKGSALVEWWISGDDPAAIGAFRKKTEQRLLKKEDFLIEWGEPNPYGHNYKSFAFALDYFDIEEEEKGILGGGPGVDYIVFGLIGCYLCCSIIAAITIFLCNRTSSNQPPIVQVNRDGNRRQSIANRGEEDQTDIGALEGVSEQEIQEEQAISGRVDAEELV